VWECECLPAPSSALAGQVELAALKAYGDFKSRTKFEYDRYHWLRRIVRFRSLILSTYNSVRGDIKL
jgi:hypothetical protein